MASQIANVRIVAHINENIEATRHWPLRGESTGNRWIPSQRASNTENIPFDDIVIKPLQSESRTNGLHSSLKIVYYQVSIVYWIIHIFP